MVFGDGRPFLGHVAIATSTGIDKTSPQDSPGVPASSYPIKGRARALQRRDGRSKTQAISQAQISKGTQPIDQHLKQSPLYSHSSFETWAQFPLSQLVTPTQALRCKENTILSPPLDVGPSFARTRINPRVSSLHHHPDYGHATLDSLIGLGPPQDQTPIVGALGRGRCVPTSFSRHFSGWLTPNARSR
jgi:hypothetical protein